MASQVLSGVSSPSYTNNTGQNVRVVINYMASASTGITRIITLNWAGVSITGQSQGLEFGAFGVNPGGSIPAPPFAIGRGVSGPTTNVNIPVLPTELILAPGQVFSAVCAVYNIVVIPEAG